MKNSKIATDLWTVESSQKWDIYKYKHEKLKC